MAIYEEFIGRERDSFSDYKDLMQNYKITYKDDFNFAYDVIDRLGTEKPDKRAMVWLSGDKQTEKTFNFRDIMLWSNKAANFLKNEGFKKGDRILLVLKRSYYFWFLMLGAHKLGVVPIQATNMLVGHDYTYRCNKAEITAVFITGDGECAEHFDAVESESVLDLLKGHLLFFEGRTGNTYEDYKYTGLIDDGVIRFSTAGRTPTQIGGETCYEVTLYWEWPATYHDIVNNLNEQGGTTEKYPYELAAYIDAHRSYFFASNATSNDSQKLSNGYDDGDQNIGNNVQFIVVYVTESE